MVEKDGIMGKNIFSVIIKILSKFSKPPKIVKDQRFGVT